MRTRIVRGTGLAGVAAIIMLGLAAPHAQEKPAPGPEYPLAAYDAAAVWGGDPRVSLFKNTMRSPFWNGYKGPISEASGQANAEYVTVQMCAAVASGQSTPQEAVREAVRRAQRIFRN